VVEAAADDEYLVVIAALYFGVLL